MLKTRASVSTQMLAQWAMTSLTQRVNNFCTEREERKGRQGQNCTHRRKISGTKRQMQKGEVGPCPAASRGAGKQTHCRATYHTEGRRDCEKHGKKPGQVPKSPTYPMCPTSPTCSASQKRAMPAHAPLHSPKQSGWPRLPVRLPTLSENCHLNGIFPVCRPVTL